MLPDDWSTWTRTCRKRALWEPAASTTQLSLGQAEIERRRIDPDDPIFAGHFPGDPVYPGMLQLEMAGQLGVWLAQRLNAGGDGVVSCPVSGAS